MDHILKIVVLAVLASPISAAITAYAGQAYVWDLHLARGGPPDAVLQFSSTNKLDVGESLNWEFYEDSTAEAPLKLIAMSGTPNGINGYIYVAFADNGYFQDLDGVIVVRVLSGSVDIRSLYVSTRINGVNYFASKQPTIPEPGSVHLVALIAVWRLAAGRKVTREESWVTASRGAFS